MPSLLNEACLVTVCSLGIFVLFLQPPEVASKPPGASITGPKATPQNQFSEHDKTLYRWVHFVAFIHRTDQEFTLLINEKSLLC